MQKLKSQIAIIQNLRAKMQYFIFMMLLHYFDILILAVVILLIKSPKFYMRKIYGQHREAQV